MSMHKELFDRCSVLKDANFKEVTPRLVHIREWMNAQPDIKKILDALRNDPAIVKIVAECDYQSPPQAADAQQIASVGLMMLDACAERSLDLASIAIHCGVHDNSGNLSAASDEAMRRYVVPFLNYVLGRLPEDPVSVKTGTSNRPVIPVAIQESLAAFRRDHPDTQKTCFVMMQFSESAAHGGIEQTIKKALSKYGFAGLLARDKEYHEDLYPNIQTYMHGCGFGIAVFERIEQDDFNPNVSLEVGYMLGLKKGVLLLKERTLKSLHADLVGKLYRLFDVQDVAKTIPPEIEHWMEDKGLI